LPKKEKAFEKLLLEAIDNALTSLGESARQAIYFHLENRFKIARKDIPHRLGDFEIGLEKIFGLGAQFIKILIMKDLYGKIGHPLEWKEGQNLMFTDYVEAARQTYLKRNKTAKL